MNTSTERERTTAMLTMHMLIKPSRLKNLRKLNNVSDAIPTIQ